MFEEPYRWIEAVGNRRQYLDAQFSQGSPVVALSCQEGVLLFTLSSGTSKLYEIYDHVGLGGMGHPADLEKLRFSLLEMAHVEGFNRSPADVTGPRLVKYGLAPVIKQAFEEIFKAPFIVKILLAQLGRHPAGDSFMTIDYDGSFEERNGRAVLAATPSLQQTMLDYMSEQFETSTPPLERAVLIAAHVWALGAILQHQANTEGEEGPDPSASDAHQRPDKETLMQHVRDLLPRKTLECAILERNAPKSFAYRQLSSRELSGVLPPGSQQ